MNRRREEAPRFVGGAVLPPGLAIDRCAGAIRRAEAPADQDVARSGAVTAVTGREADSAAQFLATKHWPPALCRVLHRLDASAFSSGPTRTRKMVLPLTSACRMSSGLPASSLYLPCI